MSNLINQYPYTNFQEVNLDYIIKLCRENMGLHLEVNGQTLLLKTADGRIISNITVPYASEAGSAATATQANYAATAGTAAQAQYAATAGSASTASNATEATHAATADLATSATTAATATNATYATTAGSATNATNAVNAQNATYAESTGSVEHAEKAFENVSQNGDALRFTAYDNSTTDITPAFATKAQKDNLGNVINSTYIADVAIVNGDISFKDANGNEIVSITPASQTATEDSYGNTIADFVKTITATSDSNYVTVSHGTGTAETLTINYSNTAWKDTNGNIIKNTYIKRLAIVTDPNDGHKKLVAYNGDTPEAELFRIPVEAYSAQIAAEASHAAAADYATNAGYATSAGTALTSTGSVSGISSPATEQQKLVISNGNGSSTTIDLFDRSNPKVLLVGAVSQTMPFDAGFTVGHSEEYSAEDFGNYGWDTADESLEAGVSFSVLTDDRTIVFTAQGYSSLGSGIVVNVYDGNDTAIKVFSISTGNSDDTLIVERLM